MQSSEIAPSDSLLTPTPPHPRRRATDFEHLALSQIADAVIAVDNDQRITYFNAAASVMYGVSREFAVGKVMLDLCLRHWNDSADADYAERALATHGSWRGESEHVLSDGRILSVDLTMSAIGDGFGNRVGSLAVIRDVTTHKRADAELEARAERESLISRISRATHESSDPVRLQSVVTAILAESLNVDRCYYARYDGVTDHIYVAADWRRPELSSLAGRIISAGDQFMFDELFSGGTAVVPDTRSGRLSSESITLLEGLDQRAVLAAPFFEGGRLTAALFASCSRPREWSSADTILVEQAAVLTRTAVESTSLRLREHTIAEQLQIALQPPIPNQIPGMRLAHFYRAALTEAGVGGDFVNVFECGARSTCLVVGDVSGKGLLAATEVATVRNMVRYALYNGRTVAGPIASVSDTLESHRLVCGFATIFASCYDANTRSLTYVNGGQDSALVISPATGQIRTLATTGPVVGAFPEARFTEEVVILNPGDVLIIYTDGLSEAGPSHLKMLTEEGVAGILGGLTAFDDPVEVAQQLMAGIDAYSRGGMRDDQCLLVAVVSE